MNFKINLCVSLKKGGIHIRHDDSDVGEDDNDIDAILDTQMFLKNHDEDATSTKTELEKVKALQIIEQEIKYANDSIKSIADEMSSYPVEYHELLDAYEDEYHRKEEINEF